MYILDTNVVSELRKAHAGTANPGVASWAAGVPPAAFYLSVVTVLELELGVLLIERLDLAQASHLRAWLDNRVLPAFADRILPIDESVARRCASLHVPNPRPERDALIAATALTHGMTVVTRNLNDFDLLGLSVLNPWT
jgi:toxin FitB